MGGEHLVKAFFVLVGEKEVKKDALVFYFAPHHFTMRSFKGVNVTVDQLIVLYESDSGKDRK